MADAIPPVAVVATIEQTCRLFQTTRPTIYRMLDRHELASVKLGRKRMITVRSIDALLANTATVGAR